MADSKTVLIADDEQLICELLKKIIDWDGLHLQLIGEVQNGRELYEAILKRKPDIVITDICMPEMNGIELIGKIRQEGIGCHFVIVSGYRQFEYAHNALKYDVEDYILKPVDAKELNGTLSRLIRKIGTEEAGFSERLLPEQREEFIKRFFLNHFISELKEKSMTLEEIEKEFGLHFQEGYFQILYVKFDILDKSQDYADDKFSLQNKIAAAFCDMFQKICTCILTDQSFDLLKIGINYPVYRKNEINGKIKEYFEKIQNFVDLFKGYHMTIGVGHPYAGIEAFSISEKEAEAAVGSRVLLGCDRIIYWDNLDQPKELLNEAERKLFFKNLEKYFELLETDKFRLQMQALFHEARSRFSCVDLMDIIEETLELFLKIEEKLVPGKVNEDFIRKQYYYGIRSAVSIPMLQNAVTVPISEALESLTQCVKQQNAKPVRVAAAYVEENYAKQIRLEDVAEQVDLNPVYFSNIFKKETGENFTDYLAGYRMNIAKELLRNTNDTVNEIAEKTGYPDTRYFSKLFKKIVGIKPSDYRKIYG